MGVKPPQTLLFHFPPTCRTINFKVFVSSVIGGKSPKKSWKKVPIVVIKRSTSYSEYEICDMDDDKSDNGGGRFIHSATVLSISRHKRPTGKVRAGTIQATVLDCRSSYRTTNTSSICVAALVHSSSTICEFSACRTWALLPLRCLIRAQLPRVLWPADS